MCGIAGIIGKTPKKTETIQKMVDIITHRGPDEDGFYEDKDVAFGMRRLSIIDLSTGKQPIENEDGNLSIVFNGEIYNYHELYEELKGKGHVFKTKSDTEVLIHLFEEEGEEMLMRLRGMFAFSIYKKTTKEFFIARDFFGIKPLYYLVKDEQIVAFGSEVKSLLLYPNFKKEINHEAVLNYFSYQYNPLEETFFKGIWKLPPASFLRINIDTGEVTQKTYWNYSFKEPITDEKVLKEKVLSEMEESVKAHMISDVPVGAFLSGGIDSAVIVALMSKNTDKKVSTFTIGFDKVTEANEAREMADFIQTDHTEITLTPEEYLKELPKIVWHFDEPVADPSAVALYFLAREARKKVKVVLSGEGSDELFGGYNIYREPIDLARLNIIPKSIREGILRPLVHSRIHFFGKNYLRRYFTKLEDRYIGNANIFNKKEIKHLWKHEDNQEEALSLAPFYKEMRGLTDSQKMQKIDIKFWLQGDILQKADKMTMANSLELRVPFLDKKIADLSEQIPEIFKYKAGKTKYILREAMKGILPKKTAGRKKLGFPTALRHWLKDKPELFSETILENEYINEHFKLGYIKHLFKEHTEGNTDNSRKIYVLYMLALWYNVYIKDSLLV
ncbi:MAG: asparagine synthase (glutamine-hydrolyzing) [Candidatus Paceibacterota bacterium]|jgi:asparagine synthase (glutamine-hydrolysing)